MKVYDAHMHIGGYKTPNPEELIEKLAEGGVYGGGVMSIDPKNPGFTYKERMDNLFAWVKGYEDRLFPLAWLHPHEENVLDKVRDCADRGVAGFKFITDDYYVTDEMPEAVFRLIEELGFPIFFHTGILYDFEGANICYTRPANWENFTRYKNIKFSMSHCSFPWYDECIAIRGKFDWMANHTELAANGEQTQYADYPWVKEHIVEKDGKRYAQVPQVYMDTTPGANGVYRKDLLTKLHSYFPDARHIMFGTDMHVERYSPDVAKFWLQTEKEIWETLGASESFQENFYEKSFLEFMEKAV